MASKDRKKDLAILAGNTDGQIHTALGRFTKDSKLQKNPSSGVPGIGIKNTSALLENYQRISESMTFDYSVDSQANRSRF